MRRKNGANINIEAFGITFRQRARGGCGLAHDDQRPEGRSSNLRGPDSAGRFEDARAVPRVSRLSDRTTAAPKVVLHCELKNCFSIQLGQIASTLGQIASTRVSRLSDRTTAAPKVVLHCELKNCFSIQLGQIASTLGRIASTLGEATLKSCGATVCGD